MVDENICHICGGVKSIEYTIRLEQGGPVEMRVTPHQIPRFCLGHPRLAMMDQFQNLVEVGLASEGARHKQWVLRQIGKMFDLDLRELEGLDEGVAP